jgi:hypothetical protein
MALGLSSIRQTHSRLVVQVTAEFTAGARTPSERATSAVSVALDWLRDRQRIQLPDSAYRGESFEVDAAEAFPVSAVRFDNYWSLQFDKFDPRIPGRIWRTELSVAFTDTRALGGVRLTVLDSSSGLDFSPSIPAVVRSWVQSPGLFDYSVQLSDAPQNIASAKTLDELAALMTNPLRSRPIVVFAEGKGIDAAADALRAAQRLAGVAHVFVLAESQARRLIERFGREFSVWGGAVRTYAPGFNPATDEVSQHPPATREWLLRRFRGIDQFVEVLLRSFTAITVKQSGLDQDLPSFRTVKQASLNFQLASLPTPLSDERSVILGEEVLLLRQQVQEKTDEFNYADSEVTAAQAERDQYRAQVMAMRALIGRLEDQLEASVLTPNYPSDLAEIDDWALKNYAGRLILLNRAARACKKSPFQDPELIYRCLDRLARQYVDARRDGAAVDGLFADLGISLERTGDPDRLSQWKEKYFIPHRGTNRFLESHLKRGSDHNEATTLRIYFFYDEDDEVVIVGHLPGHLTNSQS